MIVGGRDAGKVVSRLRSKDIPVVLRLDFPEEPKVPTEAEYRRRSAEPSETSRSRSWPSGTLKPGRSGSPSPRPSPPPTSASPSPPRPRPANNAATFHAQLRKAIAAGLSRRPRSTP